MPCVLFTGDAQLDHLVKGCCMWARREPRRAPRGIGRVGPRSHLTDFRRADV